MATLTQCRQAKPATKQGQIKNHGDATFAPEDHETSHLRNICPTNITKPIYNNVSARANGRVVGGTEGSTVVRDKNLFVTVDTDTISIGVGVWWRALAQFVLYVRR